MTEGRTKELERGEKRLWASLDDLRREPKIEARRANEFFDPPPLAALAGSGDPSRRDFAKLLALGLAAAGCSRAPVREAVPFVDQPEELTPGTALHYATTCAGCSAACPVVVKTRDGRAIKIEGNRLAPELGGGTCAVGQATVLSLYDDDRFRGPRWRGEATTWSDLDRRVRRHMKAARAAGGRVAVLTGTVVSPSSRALLEEFVEHHQARWVSWDAVSSASVRRAHQAVFGVSAVPSYRLDLARAVVGLEADFLATGSAPVEHAHAYARARRLPGMLWHGQIESRLSPTGANADFREPVEASEIGAVAVALLSRIQQRLGGDEAAAFTAAAPLSRDLEAALDVAAETLWRHRGNSAVICGVADPAVQEVVCALNQQLDNYGRTLNLDRPSLRCQGDEEDLSRLLDEMRHGEIHVLLLWGVNPGYQHPRAAEVVEAMERVALSVSFAGRPDETIALVDAVAPDHHFLESWSDAEPVRGRLSLSQPTTAPLFDTRAAQASLLAWMDREPDALAHLRRHWRHEVFPRQDSFSDFETFWSRAVHDGVLDLTGDPVKGREPVPPAAAYGLTHGARVDPGVQKAVERIVAETAETRRRRQAGGLDLVLYEKVGLRDGRWAHVPWLQELPDPVSRVTWGNYAALAPATAERLGLDQGDEVRLEVDDLTVELPVVVQPGQAPGTVAVALGYGRRVAGSVAEGVGADAFPLIDDSSGLCRYHRSGASLTATGRYKPLASTQTHHLLEGRPHVHETTLAAWRRNPAAGHPATVGSHAPNAGHGPDRSHGPDSGPAKPHAGGTHGELPSLWEERPEVGYSWGMAVDLHACTGCSACVVACQAENNVPVVGADEVRRGREMHWLRIDRYYRGSPENPDTVFQPMMCQHCDHAPCETVCPVLATVHSSDGLNQQVYNRCIGTRYCANNCPYKVRRFNWFTYARNERFDFHLASDLGSMVLNPDVTVRSRGVMEKCSMCIQRIQEGKLAAREAGRSVRDGDILTACQQACPTGALTFGDWMDPESRLSHLGRDPRFYRVLEELGIRPSSGYLTKVRHRDEAPAVGPGEES